MKTDKAHHPTKEERKIKQDMLEYIRTCKSHLKIFIQEDDRKLQRKIVEEIKGDDHQIIFFSKSDSVFDMLNFSPDIIIADYTNTKIIKNYECILSY